MPDRPLPAWPRLLDAEMAARYLGISAATLCRREGMPKPVHIGRRCLWDRAQLDRFVDELSGGEAASFDDAFAEGAARASRSAHARKVRAA